MKNLGRWIGVACMVAVPAAAIFYLYSKPEAGGGREVEEGPPYVPPPLYSGPPEEGLSFASQADPKKTDARSFAHLALYVPEGERASSFLPEGAFTATFKGKLKVPTRDRYTFTFVGTGKFELVVHEKTDKTVVTADGSAEHASGKRTRLKKGERPFTARYTSPAKGPAILRVYWECSEFAREPIPQSALGHGASESLAQFSRWRSGRRELYWQRCGQCHAEETRGPVAPSLGGVGARLREDWMAQWIEDPDTTRMPKVLHGSSASTDAADIAAFLATQGKASTAPQFTDDDRERGGVIFADSGCIACHTLPEHHDEATVANRVKLDIVAAKFHPAALVDYLRQPDRHSPRGEMPNFGFDEPTAQALAAFLLSRSGASAPPSVSGDAARGKRLIATKGCVSCHGIAVQNEMRAPGPAVTKNGSISCRVAEYGLSAEDEAALQEYLARRPGGSSIAVETAEYGMQRGRCTNCHGWRGEEPLLGRVRGETAAFAEEDPEAGVQHLPPDLTYTGSKLRTEWLVRWLKGEAKDRPRPWMHMRMPVFSLDPEAFARGFAFAAGYGPSSAKPHWRDGTALVAATMGTDFDAEPASVADLVKIGEKLIPRDGGLGCIQCHGVGDRPAQEVFEAPGINLQQTPSRIRKEFFHRWCLDPLRIDPSTKMTRFTDAEGLTGLTDVLEGRGQAQFEAIWRYLEFLPR